MKKLLLFPFMLLLAMTVTACDSDSPNDTEQPESNNENDDDEDTPNKNERYVVLFASRSGNTETMAKTISESLNCDLLEIIPTVPYDEDYNSMLERAQNEQAAIGQGNYPAINTTVDNFEKYDVIFVGYPIWHGHMATPMQAFLHNHADKLKGKRIALFASSGSSGISTSVNEARSLVSDATFTETLHLTSGTLSQMSTRITSWLEQLNTSKEENNNNMDSNTIKLTAGSKTFTATLVENSSTKALKELLAKGDLRIEMSDYGNMEKVGPLGTTLPRNDESITTIAGDLILYQGNSFVIYYAPNTWTFTRLGKIDNTTREELLAALGSGNVTVTLSLNRL